MKPWQAPFNKAPNKGREREERTRGLSQKSKKKPPLTQHSGSQRDKGKSFYIPSYNNNPSIFLATYWNIL